MMTTMTTAMGFTLPAYRATNASLDAAVRALPATGADMAFVCGKDRITDGAVVAGAFAGTSAWSPPI